MTSKCVTCLSNLPNETLYRCQTCSREQDEASGFEYFCENCLVSHIRKGHSVIDCKGNKPLVCSTHSLICLEYCKTCDVTLCYKCLGSHSKHDFQPAEVKGSELKRKVFDLLTDLEMKEKPLRLKQEKNLEIIRKNQEIAQRLEEFIKGELKKLEENVREKINQKSTTNDRLRGELTTACNDLLSLQGRTRALLSQSNANLTHNFAIVADDCSNFESRYNDSIKKESDFFNSVTDSLNKLFDSFRIEFEELLETENSSHNQANQIFHVNGLNSLLIYRVQRNHHKELSVSTITFARNGGQIITETAVENMKRNVEITHVFILWAFETVNTRNTESQWAENSISTEQIIVLLNNRIAKLYDSSSKAFERFTYPQYNNFLWPYCASDRFVHWSYWNADEKKVRFSHSFGLSFDCDHCPKIRMNGFDSNTLCFIDQNCSVFVVELSGYEPDGIEKIDKETHHLETIDSISSDHYYIRGTNTLIKRLGLWSVDSTSVTIVHKVFNSPEPFSVYRRVCWDNELAVLSLDLPDQEEKIQMGRSSAQIQIMRPAIRTISEGRVFPLYLFWAFECQIKQKPFAAVQPQDHTNVVAAFRQSIHKKSLQYNSTDLDINYE